MINWCISQSAKNTLEQTWNWKIFTGFSHCILTLSKQSQMISRKELLQKKTDMTFEAEQISKSVPLQQHEKVNMRTAVTCSKVSSKTFCSYFVMKWNKYSQHTYKKLMEVSNWNQIFQDSKHDCSFCQKSKRVNTSTSKIDNKDPRRSPWNIFHEKINR